MMLCLAAMPSPLFAQTLTIDRQITGVVHHYTPPDTPFPGFPGYVTDEIQFDTTGLTDVDLDQYQTFKLRLFAPAGQQLTVNHAGSYRSGMSVYYQAGGDSSAHTEPATLEFEGFTGSMPTRDYSLFYIGDNGNVLEFQAQEKDYAGSIEFTAMSYSFTPAYNPANSPKTFTQQSSSSIPVYFGYQTTATTDPGPFVTLSVTAEEPEIGVEQPAGVPLADGSSIAWGPAPVGLSGPTNTITIKNTGTADLTLDSVTTSGGNAAEFSVGTTGMDTTITPGNSTTFSVTFTPTGPGGRSTTLQIYSNDNDESPFDITLTGTGLSFTADGDGDGLNDASELQMAALGFKWDLPQPELVTTLTSSLNGAGYFTPAQVQALRIDTPLIQRSPAGLFTLTLGLQKSTTLEPGSFVPFPFVADDTLINCSGKIEFHFSPEDDAAFFRLETD